MNRSGATQEQTTQAEQARLLGESLFYSQWSLVFAITAIVVEAVALLEVFLDNFGRVFVLMALAGATYLFARYLGARAKRFRYQAGEISDN